MMDETTIAIYNDEDKAPTRKSTQIKSPPVDMDSADWTRNLKNGQYLANISDVRRRLMCIRCGSGSNVNACLEAFNVESGIYRSIC